MHDSRTVAAAYQVRKTQKQREAEVFSLVARRLRDASSPMESIRAAADAERLWGRVLELMVDPENALEAGLRLSVAAVAEAALREARSASPDLDFLASVAEDMAAGLAA